MGSHSMQAIALTVLLAAFVVFAAGLALGGNLLLITIGLAMLIASVFLFRRIKTAEEEHGS
jgi:glucose dehydrogenase